MLTVVDGRLVGAERATIGALDRSAWYGDGAFETFRTFGRKVLFLERRLDRLVGSLAILGIDGRPLVRALRDDLALAIASFGDADAYVRVAVSRGEGAGGLLPTGLEAPSRLVFVGSLQPTPDRFVTEGLRVVTQVSAVEPRGSRAAGAKVAAYVEPMLALREAKAGGADDAIGLDRDGLVLEAATSNLVARLGGRWWTPPRSLGVLPGITLDAVRGLAEGEGGVGERVLTVHDLYRADEIALTSSVRGIVPVTRIDGKPVGEGVPGAAVNALRHGYAVLVDNEARAVDVPADSR